MCGKERPRWVIRCQVNGRDFALETAYPLPWHESSAARILAMQDLGIIKNPLSPRLVWIDEVGAEKEIYTGDDLEVYMPVGE